MLCSLLCITCVNATPKSLHLQAHLVVERFNSVVLLLFFGMGGGTGGSKDFLIYAEYAYLEHAYPSHI